MNRFAFALLLLPIFACEITCEGDESLEDPTSPTVVAPTPPPAATSPAREERPEPVVTPTPPPEPEPPVEAAEPSDEEAAPVEAVRAPADLTPQDRIRLMPETLRSQFIDLGALRETGQARPNDLELPEDVY